MFMEEEKIADVRIEENAIDVCRELLDMSSKTTQEEDHDKWKHPVKNKFYDYTTYISKPWEYFWRGMMFRGRRRQTAIPDPSVSTRDLGDPYLDYDRFFQGPKLQHYVDKYIFWWVTSGKYRADKNKRVWVWKGTPPHILNLADPDTRKMWTSVDDSYDIIIAITEECNTTLDRLRETLERRIQNKPNIASRNALKTWALNLLDHPEFVPYPNNRDRQHKEYKWRFAAPPKMSGKRRKTAAPLRVVKQSVARMLRDYHYWLNERGCTIPTRRRHNDCVGRRN